MWEISWLAENLLDTEGESAPWSLSVSYKNVDLIKKREWIKKGREMFCLTKLITFRRVRKIWEATIRFFCLSVRPNGTTRFPLDVFR